VEDSNRKKNQVLANSLPNFHSDYATMGRVGERFKNSFSSFHNDYTAIEKKIEKLFEILGEATRKIGQATRDNFPEIDFQKVVGMHNIIAHDYNNVRMDTMWSTAHDHVPWLLRCT